MNTIFKFTFASRKWEAIKPTCALPEARAGHSAVVYKDKLIIFGGKNEENEKLNDVWSFTVPTHNWQKLTTNSQAVLPRSGHSATVHNNYMLVFGGILDVTKELDDMLLFDLEMKKWT